MVHEIRPICDHRETKRATNRLLSSKDPCLVAVGRIFRQIFAFLCSLSVFYRRISRHRVSRSTDHSNRSIDRSLIPELVRQLKRIARYAQVHCFVYFGITDNYANARISAESDQDMRSEMFIVTDCGPSTKRHG
jgi:hypothetical protein